MATSKDNVTLPLHFASYCRVYIDMERNGLACFEEDGTYGGYDGEVIIQMILAAFVELEMYTSCAFLRDFLEVYRAKFCAGKQPVPSTGG